MKYLILLIILSGCSFQQLNISESRLTLSSVNYINTPKDLNYLINDALLVKPESNTNLIIRDYKENLRDFSGGNNLSNIESQIYGEVTLEVNVDDAKNIIIISSSKKFQNNFLNPQAPKNYDSNNEERTLQGFIFENTNGTLEGCETNTLNLIQII